MLDNYNFTGWKQSSELSTRLYETSVTLWTSNKQVNSGHEPPGCDTYDSVYVECHL